MWTMMTRPEKTVNCFNFFNLFKQQDLAIQEKMLQEFTAAVTASMNRAIFRIMVDEDNLVIRFHYRSTNSYKMDGEKRDCVVYQYTFSDGRAELMQATTPELPDLKTPFSLFTYETTSVVTVGLDSQEINPLKHELHEEANHYLDGIAKKIKLGASPSVAEEKQSYPIIYTKSYGEELYKIESPPRELMKFLQADLNKSSGPYSDKYLETAVQKHFLEDRYQWHREAKYHLEVLAHRIHEILTLDSKKHFKFDNPQDGNELFQAIYSALLIAAKGKNNNRIAFALLVKLRDAYELEVGILPSKREEKDWVECESLPVQCLNKAKQLLHQQREEFRKQYQIEPVVSNLIAMAETELASVSAVAKPGWDPRIMPAPLPQREIPRATANNLQKNRCGCSVS